MSENLSNDRTCVVIGASHGGVNFAFSLRKAGWEGNIILFDKDPVLPYHRPPLSKGYLANKDAIEKNFLKSVESYEKENIVLKLGVTVTSINRSENSVILKDGSVQVYDKLILATGARPIIPSIKGIETISNLYSLRTAEDVENIRNALTISQHKSVVVIGGGYIGLEVAASLQKMGASVTVLEREQRILARVTAPEMSTFFKELHAKNGVDVQTDKNVISFNAKEGVNTIICSDGSSFEADIVIVGVGIHVNLELAKNAGLEIENGIRVDATAQTNDKDIYAIGDCTFHHNPHYDRFIRLESVQNAVDQAKVAAAAICGKPLVYDTLPWFWSDQYDIKLQMVGLSTGYNKVLIRNEESENPKFSIWYFKDDTLLAVDAVNNAKAYVLGTKFIKGNKKIDQSKLIDSTIDFKPANLLIE
ncbi:NAD(P)/FAD-dependent oxidoreductase [Aquimarina algiphila]|uniref:Pyridine nucleotide-disulfide oxidoreductase n=1 Tax=Aquimarina algiphila TaxID=2047982 RepID=A0A554VD32_9FLAO|nr:FAD-dependent oxidoreductase [Aquimarina algiphila]TSE04720.1 pyridine nucleotide-disulfide oxidoreductase [Aquimarina algiphila]